MQLDVIIPTYNRQGLLPSALNSLLTAEIPPGMEVGITVVDNNSTDGTRQVIESFGERSGGRVRYCFERQQGRSHALNAGVKATSGDLVGVIDDDEEIDGQWFRIAFEAFKNSELDFIGGPYVPRWSITPPAWLPPEYGSVVGWVNGGDQEVPFDENYGSDGPTRDCCRVRMRNSTIVSLPVARRECIYPNSRFITMCRPKD
jgi:glycosyltransferase involved in cell wall biosynthesis